jgi:spore coat polysaccharide biosynthesis predicted glycosyltransferase SpsG
MFEYEAIKEASVQGKKIQRTALIIGGSILFAIFVGLLVWWIIKKLKGNDLVDQSKKDVNKRNLTYDLSKYEQMASAIYKAMEYLTTDEDTIYRNIDMLRNADDWKQLVVAFGVKDDKNLVEYLIYELDSDEQSNLNAILSKTGESI